MRKRVIMLAAIAAIAATLSAQRPVVPAYPVYDDAKAAYLFIDPEGEPLAWGSWELAQPFADGRAAVRKGGLWGYLDEKGALVLPCAYRLARSFSEGLAAVLIDLQWGYIDKAGKMVAIPVWDEAAPFSEGLAAVKLQGMWGYLSKSGAKAIDPSFEAAGPFSSGRALVRRGGRSFYIDSSGKEAFSALGYDELRGFSEGLAAARLGARWGFIDKAGKMAIAPQWLEALDYREGLVAARTGSGWAFYDSSGRRVSPTYAELRPFSSGYAAFKSEEGFWGVMDKGFRPILAPSFARPLAFEGALARFEADEAMGSWFDARGREYGAGGLPALELSFPACSGDMALGTSWKAARGGLVMEVPGSGGLRLALSKNYRSGDAAIAARFDVAEGPGGLSYGLVFRYRGPGDYSTFEANPAGYFRVSTVKAGEWSDALPWTRSSALAGGTVELGVTMRESGASFSISGRVVAFLPWAPGELPGYFGFGVAAEAGLLARCPSLSYRQLSRAEAGRKEGLGFSRAYALPADASSFAFPDDGFSVSSGGMAIERAGGYGRTVSYDGMLPSYSIAFDLSVAKGDTGARIGLLFWMLSDDYAYRLGVAADGAAELRMINGAVEAIVARFAIPKGARVELRCAQGRVSALANGRELWSGGLKPEWEGPYRWGFYAEGRVAGSVSSIAAQER
jgi:hypothetical protein